MDCPSAPSSPPGTRDAAARPRPRAQDAVTVRAPARLHLGFLDPSGTLGRRFGGLGLVIDGFACALTMAPADATAGADGYEAAGAAAQAEQPRVAEALASMRARTGFQRPLRVTLHETLPAHAGFGSGTQLALAVGRAFAELYDLVIPTPVLAQWLGRGRRSGIGIAGFDEGGLLVDGGPRADATPAPLLARCALPEAWRIVVVQDPRQQGLSGAQERQAIAQLPAFAQAHAAQVCHEVLMRVLPGAANGEFEPFALGLNRLQTLLGEHFAPAQGGSAWASPAVGRLMQHLRGQAHAPRAAIGQSSWGPTGFAIVPSAALAQALLNEARHAGALDVALAVRVVAARAAGAVTHRGAPDAAHEGA